MPARAEAGDEPRRAGSNATAGTGPSPDDVANPRPRPPTGRCGVDIEGSLRLRSGAVSIPIVGSGRTLEFRFPTARAARRIAREGKYGLGQAMSTLTFGNELCDLRVEAWVGRADAGGGRLVAAIDPTERPSPAARVARRLLKIPFTRAHPLVYYGLR